jgi:integrase
VDLTRETIRIQRKGGDTRLIPIAPRLKVLLADHVRARGSGDLGEPLFVNRDGARMSGRAVNRWFYRTCKRAGLEQQRYTPHADRRRIADLMATEGFSMFDIQEFLGHEDPKTTARYVQASAGTIRRRMTDSEVFGEEQTETIPTDRVTRLENKVDDLATSIGALIDRLSPPAEEGVYAIGDAPQLRNAVRHQR